MAITLLFLLMLLFPTAGLTQVDSQLVEAAKKEGELVLYSSANNEEAGSMVEGFRKLYPFINASFYRSGDYALMTRIQTEARAGRHAWDVADMTTYTGYWLAQEGFFAKYPAPERKFIRQGHLDDQAYWTSSLSNVNVVVYNTKLVPRESVPKRYEDLLDPNGPAKWRWKNMPTSGLRMFCTLWERNAAMFS
jgi:iron(III) transport system substrate-binding protein